MKLSMAKLLSCLVDHVGEAHRGAKMAAVTSLHSKTERKKAKNEQIRKGSRRCDMHRSLLHSIIRNSLQEIILSIL